MLHMAPTFTTPYYAVIFISMKAKDGPALEAMQTHVVEKLKGQKGLLGMDRYRNAEGLGFSISYWDSLENIQAWRMEPTHAKAQEEVRKEWYSEYVIRTCTVEYDSSFSRTKDDAEQ